MNEGEITLAHKLAKEALMLAQETGDVFIKGLACSAYGYSCYGKGLFDEARTHFLEWLASYKKSTPMLYVAIAYMSLGDIYMDLRKYDDAVNCYQTIIPIMENNSYLPFIRKLIQTSLVRAKVLRRDQDIELSELFECYENYKFTWCKGGVARNISDVLLHIDDNHLADAGSWFQKAIEADTKNGFRWQLAMDHAGYTDWFKKKGDVQGAKEQLTRAIDIFRECGADGWVSRTEKTLAEIV